MENDKKTSALRRKNRLKEIQKEKILELEKLRKEKEKEIESLKEEVAAAENEVRHEEEYEEKVPIPQVASEALKELSGSAKEIIKQHKGKKVKANSKFAAVILGDGEAGSLESEGSLAEGVEGVEAKLSVKEDESLEGQIEKERIDLQAFANSNLGRRAYGEILEISKTVPTISLYNQMRSIYEGVAAKGYVSGDEQQRMYELGSAIEEKVSDVRSGGYEFTTDVAKAASASLAIRDKVNSIYLAEHKSKSMIDNYKV